MPIARVQLPDGKIGRFEVPEGTTPEQATAAALQHFQSMPAPAVKPSAPLEDKGYFGNYYEGLGNAMRGAKQAILDPAAAALADTHVGKFIDDMGQKIGLPSAKQANAYTQAGIDADKASGETDRLNGTVGGFVGSTVGNGLLAYAGGAAAKAVPGVNALVGMAGKAAPYINAAASGAGVGYVQPVATGEGRGKNVVIGAIGGVGGQALNAAGSTGVNYVSRKLAARAADNADSVIADAVKSAGLTLDKASSDSLKTEVQKALNAGGKIDADALRRKIDILAIGGRPTLGMITREPQQFATEQTLKGINGAGAPLASAIDENNAALVGGLNRAGADKAAGTYGTGKTLLQATQGFIDQKKGEIGGLYAAAKDSAGRPAALDHVKFANDANDALDKAMIGKFIPSEIRDTMNDFATGKIPLDVQHAEIFKTMIGNAQRSTQDGNAKAALGIIRGALDDAPLMSKAPAINLGERLLTDSLPAKEGNQIGQEAIDAFNKARSANRQFMGTVEATPALSAVHGADNPEHLADSFFQKHVVSAPVSALKANIGVWQQAPEAAQALKTQTLDYLKAKALNGASDEVGKFSQSGFNKALNGLGDAKLALIFKPEEIAQLKALGRVASYMQVAPAGAAVNTSNTAAQVANLLMENSGSMGRNALMAPLRSITDSRAANKAVGAAIPSRMPIIANPYSSNRLLQMLGTTAALDAAR